MNDQKSPAASSSRPSWLTNRVIIGIVIAVLLLLFISLNHQKTQISFIVFSAEASLWVALALAGAAGFLAGYLLGRKHGKQ